MGRHAHFHSGLLLQKGTDAFLEVCRLNKIHNCLELNL